MNIDALIQLCTQAMLLCMYVSMPIVLVGALVGLLISFVQAITSTQDQNLTQGVKMVAIVATIFISAPLSASAVKRFLNQVLSTALPQ
jgi:type III secretion protein S